MQVERSERSGDPLDPPKGFGVTLVTCLLNCK
jgi:hypothetical protein